MKTAELTGALLDYWVAKAEAANDTGSLGHICIDRMDLHGETWTELWESAGCRFRPSSDWAQAGPIIDREKISILYPMFYWLSGFYPEPASHYANDGDSHFDLMGEVVTMRHEHSGEHLLTVAMRAYVASKFGKEVPDI